MAGPRARDLLETLRSDDLPPASPEFYVDWDGIRTRILRISGERDGVVSAKCTNSDHERYRSTHDLHSNVHRSATLIFRHAQQGITEEFKAFVVLPTSAAVGQRLLQQARLAKGVSQALLQRLQIVGHVLTWSCP